MAFSFEYDPLTGKGGVSVGTPPKDLTKIGRDRFGENSQGGTDITAGKSKFISSILDKLGIHTQVGNEKTAEPEAAADSPNPKAEKAVESATAASWVDFLDKFDTVFKAKKMGNPSAQQNNPIKEIDPDVAFLGL